MGGVSLSSAPRLAVIVPGPLRQATGGYRYDARIVDGLRAIGWDVAVDELEGTFPEGDRPAREALQTALDARQDGDEVVIDGLALGNLGDVVTPHLGRLRITALVHHPLGDEAGLDEAARRRLHVREIDVLERVHRLVVTSRFTARRLVELGVTRTPIEVVEPGVAPAPLARGAWPSRAAEAPRLLCVATLTPRKGHRVMLEALAMLRHRPWRLECVGDDRRAPEESQAIRRDIMALGLQNRVSVAGCVNETALARCYHEADLVLVPSFYEGYGMVVTEALARGLPLVSTLGGALRDTVPPEAAWRVEPGRSEAFAAAIAQWWSSEERDAKRRGAAHGRLALAGWERTVERFADSLAGSPGVPAGVVDER